MAESITVGGISVPIMGDDRDLVKKLGDVEKKSGDAGKKAGEAFAGRYNDQFKKLSLTIIAAVTGIVVAFKRVVDAMDAVGKQSQSLGVTVETMSRLQYAARVSGASVEDLNTAMISLSRRMGEREELSEGVRIFSALGVSVTDATGKMKSADRVLSDLADRFSRMEDGAGKTEIAVRLFGDSGARLIPLLNQGSEGLAELNAQSDALGGTLSSKTSAAVQDFDKSVERVTLSVEGWARKVVSDILPALTYLANDLVVQAREVSETDKKWNAFNTTLRILLSTGEAIRATFSALGSVIGGVVNSLLELGKGEFKKAWFAMNDGLEEAVERMNQGQRNMAVIWSDWSTTIQKEGTKAANNFKKTAAPVIQTAESITKNLNAIRLANQYAFQDLMQSDLKPVGLKFMELEAMVRGGTISFHQFSGAIKTLKEQSGADAMREILSVDTTPFAQRIQELNTLVENGSIKWREYQAAVRTVTDSQKSAMNDLASTTAQALTTIFENNKTAAIAAAIINTAQGVTKALSEYPPPYSFAMAALQGAMGLAQIAKIRSTTQSTSGGGSAPSAAAPAASAPAQQTQKPTLNQTMTVQGINVSQLYSGSQVKELASKLLDYQRDGGKVVLV